MLTYISNVLVGYDELDVGNRLEEVDFYRPELSQTDTIRLSAAFVR